MKFDRSLGGVQLAGNLFVKEPRGNERQHFAFARRKLFIAMEYVKDGIRVNTISVGVVDTPMHANDDHEFLKTLHPFPRLVQVSEIVDALFYLHSAPMVNGENIRIDGGAHAGAKW
jgi:enoyl-[acyl-carrier-protein] reductase (NADH)